MNDGVEFFRVGLNMHESAMRAMASRLADVEAKMIAFEQLNSRMHKLERRNAVEVDRDDEPDHQSDSGDEVNSFKGKGKGKDKDKRKDSGKVNDQPAKKSKVAPKSRGKSSLSHSL